MECKAAHDGGVAEAVAPYCENLSPRSPGDRRHARSRKQGQDASSQASSKSFLSSGSIRTFGRFFFVCGIRPD
jgi:hypothetical protein